MRIIQVFVFLFSVAIFAQNKTLKGIVTEGETNEPLPYVSIIVDGTDYFTETDESGAFEMEVPNKENTISVFYVGYENQQIVCPAEQNFLQIELLPSNEDLDELVISVVTNKEAEQVILDEQRRSLDIKQEIGAAELSRKGVSDAAAAVAKTSGVSKQSTGSVFIRGLGDRYNSTFLNGLPLVSNDPENKNIDLSIFASDVISKISIDKTFLVGYSGDFGGASVDIASKKVEKEGFFEIGLSTNVNSHAMKQDQFLLPQGYSGIGFQSGKEVPTQDPNSYFFTKPFNVKGQGPIGFGITMNGGKKWYLEDDKTFSIFATLSHDNKKTFIDGLEKTVNAQGVRLKEYDRQSYSFNTQTTAMINAVYEAPEKYLFQYNTMLLNTSDLSYNRFRGFIRDLAERDGAGLVQRNVYNQNTLLVNQLLMNYRITDVNEIQAGISYNNVLSAMPDRTQTMLIKDENSDDYRFITNSKSDNHRYFHGLKENELSSKLSMDHKFGANEDGTFKGRVVAGYNLRMKDRNFKATQYNYGIANSHKQDVIDPNNIDGFFNQEMYEQGYFDLSTFRGTGNGSGEPQYYEGTQNIHALFSRLEYQVTPKLTAIVGLRFENIFQEVRWKTQLDNNGNSSELKKNAILPALHLKYEINTIQNLRLSASKTYTLPQFKERVRFIYEDVTEVKFGNEDLYASDNYNLDLKWEYFPKNDEVISATIFGKYIQNPINQTNVASASNDITYVNTGDYGIATGIELEMRKQLMYFKGNLDNKLSMGVNVALMKTMQELNSEKISRETKFTGIFSDEKAAFTGAPNVLLNTDLTYSNKWNQNQVMATLVYQYASDQIYALGTQTKGNLVDRGFGTLDFILKTSWNDRIDVGLSIKNITDAKIRREQENESGHVEVRNISRGSDISLSMKYKF